MPPFGLYPIPRHHLYDQSPRAQRQTYNSMDFAAEELDKEKITEARAKKKQERRERKEKKREKERLAEAEKVKGVEKGEKEKQIPLPRPSVDAMSMTPAKRDAGKKGEKVLQRTPVTVVKRKGESDTGRKREEAVNRTPATATKRRRESEAHVGASTPTNNDLNINNLLLDPNFLEGLRSAMGNLGAVFDEPAKSTESPSTAPPPKKRGRPVGWRKSAAVESAKIDISNTETVDDLALPGEVEPKKHAPGRDEASGSTPNKVFNTPVPLPWVAPKKTPVPLPQQPHRTSSDNVSGPQTEKTKNVRPEFDVLVTETPPSNMRPAPDVTPRQSAIPFSLSQRTSPPSTQSKKTKKGPTINISPSEEHNSVSDKSAKADKYIIGSQGSVNPLTSSQADDFTAATLINYKQPLNDNPKPRPVSRRRRRASSEAASSVSSSTPTSRSIRDMLTRIPPPYARAAATNDPFVTTPKEKQASGAMETHKEADVAIFTAAYQASQHTINFTDELSYLAQHDAHVAASTAAGALPCLHKATGCSPKHEQMLRLQRETASPSTPTTRDSSATAITHANQATTLLRHALSARIPVALGPIAGVWKLFCPSYTAVHTDKYGFGLRSLTIYSATRDTRTTGRTTDHSPSYTARLCIPPRPMAFTLAAFEAPPHASFRATTLRTVDEGYAMDVRFLGNGYLKLRVDVHLLLMGRRAVEAVGKAGGAGAQGKGVNKAFGVWEFLGVHEGAVAWEM